MGEYRLHAERLSVGYGGKPVLRDVALTVRSGEILTLIGPNGAGKSTLLKTFIRQLEPIHGAVFLDGEPMDDMSEHEMARKLSIVVTDRPDGDFLTVEEVVNSGRYPYTGRLGLLSARDREIVEEAMKLTAVAPLRNRYFRQLSDGQRQRVLLARAICQEPEILVMDEPTSFLDIRYQFELLALLRELASKRGLAVILSLHELDFVRRVSDTVLCVRDGVADRTGPPDILTADYIESLYGLPPGSYTECFGSIPARKGEKHYSFTQNRDCEYFPCHEGIAAEDFNCLFCYCPLYTLGERCGGNFTYTERGVKNCAECKFPHARGNYEAVLARFPELSELARKRK